MNLEQIIIEEYHKIVKEQQKTSMKWPKGFKYGYSFGELGKDPVDERGGNKFRYGASMNKPILAFVNHVLAKEKALNTRSGKPIRRLTDQELNRMISYSGGSNWSNRVNRATSNMSRVPGKDSWGHKTGYYDKYSREVGVSKKQAQDVLNRVGLSDTIKGIHWGGANNQQSTRGYSKFMSLMNQMKSDPKHKYHDEATRVLSFVNKRKGGTGARGLKKYLNKKLENAGYGENAVQSIYGKGGYVKGTLNYSVVINDKYVLSLYSKMPGKSVTAMRPNLNKIAFNTITKNLKPGQLGAGSPERQQQDLEVDDWNRREADRAAAIADVDIYTDVSGQEADWWVPEEFDKDLDLKAIPPVANPAPEQMKRPLTATDIPLPPKRPTPEDILQEAAMPLIKVDMTLRYEKDFSFYGNVLNQIRSIKGIAIAKASDMGVIDVGPSKKMVLMHLKFMPDRPLHQYLIYLQVELKKIKDKDGDRIIATQIKGIPTEVEV